MSIEAKLPDLANGGVSVTFGRTSEGIVTRSFSTRYRRASSTDRATEGMSVSGFGCSSESDFMTCAGVFEESIRFAVSTNAA